MSSLDKSARSSIDWKRARRDETDLAHRRTWESRDKQYRVIESVGKFTEMGTHWYGILMVPHQHILYVGRSERQAYMACERHLNPPKKRKKKRIEAET